MTLVYVRSQEFAPSEIEVIFATMDREKAFAYLVPRTWDGTMREANWYDRVHIYEDEKLIDTYDFEENNARWTSMYNSQTAPPIPVNIIIQETSCPQKIETLSLPAGQ